MVDGSQIADKAKRVAHYATTFESEDGQRVLNELIQRYYVLRPIPLDSGELAMAFMEGQRSVVLDLLDKMAFVESAPQLVHRMSRVALQED